MSDFSRYFPRSIDLDLENEIIDFATSDLFNQKIFVVHGESGTGKTTAVSKALSRQRFQSAFSGDVVWVDLADHFYDCPNDPKTIVGHLSKRLAHDLPIELPVRVIASKENFEFTDLRRLLRGYMFLLVFDDSRGKICQKTVKFLKKLASFFELRCLLITSDVTLDWPADMAIKLFHIKQLSIIERKSIFSELSINQQEIDDLTAVVGTLPVSTFLTSTLIRQDKSNYRLIYDRLKKVNNRNQAVYVELLNVFFNTDFGGKNGKISFENHIFPLLLFKPGEAICFEDLVVLWNMDDPQSFVEKHSAVGCLSKLTKNRDFLVVNPIVHRSLCQLVEGNFRKMAEKFTKSNKLLKNAVDQKRYRLLEVLIGSIGYRRLMADFVQFSLIRKMFEADDDNIKVDVIVGVAERLSALKQLDLFTSITRNRILRKIIKGFENLNILTLAVDRNYLNFVKYLVGNGCCNGFASAVRSAIEDENEEMVQLLLGSMPKTAVMTLPASLLMKSVQLKNLKIAKMLLDNWINPNSVKQDDRIFRDTALIEASRTGQLEMVENLLAFHAHPDMRNGNGETALMAASAVGDDQIVRRLLLSNANVNAKDSRGRRTALMRASERGFTNVAQLLVSCGAAVGVVAEVINLAGSSNCTALSLALTNGHFETAGFLLKRNGGKRGDSRRSVEAILGAIRSRQFKALQLLLDYNFDVNVRNPKGQSVLMLTAVSSEFLPEVLLTLLSVNADADLFDSNGDSALSLAIKRHFDNPSSKWRRQKVEILWRHTTSSEAFRRIMNDLELPFTIVQLQRLAGHSVRRRLGNARLMRPKLSQLPLPEPVKDLLFLETSEMNQ